jgi:CRP/FNR family transcriptional regulator, cyclic AMP receptor protein
MDPAPAAIPLPLDHSSSSWLARVRVATGGSVHRSGRGQILLREGDWHSCFWVIHEGAVLLASTSTSGRRGILCVLGRGGVFGEQGLAGSPDDWPSQGDGLLFEARTLTPTVLQAIPLAGLGEAMARDPQVACWVTAAVGRRAARIERALARTLILRVPLRVLGVLKDLAAEHGTACPEGVFIRLPLSQDLLASMAGASRESVNRAISDLERRGLVRRIGLRYVLSRSAPDPLEWPPSPSGSSPLGAAGGAS